MVSGVTFKPLIHFELIFVYDVRKLFNAFFFFFFFGVPWNLKLLSSPAHSGFLVPVSQFSKEKKDRNSHGLSFTNE